MLVVDASCLCELLLGGPGGGEIGARLSEDPDQTAPHIVDVEVFGVIRREHLAGRVDATASSQAVKDLRDWPGERVDHRPLLARAWELRDTVRGWDAMYVGLAEALEVPLLTRDRRLASAPGPSCEIEVI
ncbi:MAG: type II toxin-antitoxin system VapC family toxin [Solirubrobacterales bacterium]